MTTKAEALAWLKQQHDSFGECDGCHRDERSLWALPHGMDSEPDAHWQYCRECFRRFVDAADRKR